MKITQRYIKWLLFLFAFGLYANTIPYGFVLDDKLAITDNTFTKNGIKGIPDILGHDMFVGFFGRKKNLVEGGRYRPLSMVMYAIEWEFFGADKTDKKKNIIDKKIARAASVGHFINALFYGLTAIVLYIVLLQLFPPEKEKWYLSMAFIASCLWIAHPLHTEVVANIKSRDEIMGTLSGLTTLFLLLKYLNSRNIALLFLSCIVFFLGLSSKESAVIFLGVIPLTLLFFRRDHIKMVSIALIPLIITTGIYFTIRSIILGDVATGEIAKELMNDPFLLATKSEQLATIIFSLGLYIKLLFFPHPLTHDYYPWHPIADDSYKWDGTFPYLNWSDPLVIVALALYLAITAYGLFSLYRLLAKKESSVIGYSILLFLGTFILFSNLFLQIGTFMNERFMYVPSLGFCIILAYLLTQKVLIWIKNPLISERISLIVFGILLIGYSGKTITRNPAWESDYTLAVTDVEVSKNSAKVNMSAGGSLMEKAKSTKNPVEKKKLLTKAIFHLDRSLQLYPGYIQPMLLMGNTQFEIGDFDKSLAYFEGCLKINPRYNFAIKNMLLVGDTLTRAKQFSKAITAYTTLLRYKPNEIKAYTSLGEIYGKHLRDMNKSLEYLNKAAEIAPKNTDVLQKLGVVYAMTGKPYKALEIFEHALTIDPDNRNIMQNIGITYGNLGNAEEAKKYFDLAKKL